MGTDLTKLQYKEITDKFCSGNRVWKDKKLYSSSCNNFCYAMLIKMI